MPARSVAQQHYFGMLYGKLKSGDTSGLSDKDKEVMDTLGKERLKHFTATKHTGLPNKVAEGVEMPIAIPKPVITPKLVTPRPPRLKDYTAKINSNLPEKIAEYAFMQGYAEGMEKEALGLGQAIGAIGKIGKGLMTSKAGVTAGSFMAKPIVKNTMNASIVAGGAKAALSHGNTFKPLTMPSMSTMPSMPTLPKMPTMPTMPKMAEYAFMQGYTEKMAEMEKDAISLGSFGAVGRGLSRVGKFFSPKTVSPIDDVVKPIILKKAPKPTAAQRLSWNDKPIKTVTMSGAQAPSPQLGEMTQQVKNVGSNAPKYKLRPSYQFQPGKTAPTLSKGKINGVGRKPAATPQLGDVTQQVKNIGVGSAPATPSLGPIPGSNHTPIMPELRKPVSAPQLGEAPIPVPDTPVVPKKSVTEQVKDIGNNTPPRKDMGMADDIPGEANNTKIPNSNVDASTGSAPNAGTNAGAGTSAATEGAAPEVAPEAAKPKGRWGTRLKWGIGGLTAGGLGAGILSQGKENSPNQRYYG